ncbi:MAG TPA: prolipoprotein diacylglyceryl transferase family protein [Blastocatellia bacterium]|nr:prolipoprotein diacylglyceryl transferase family protein [Blastocatellia bacterium]
MLTNLHFPVDIPVGPITLPAHLVFESLAYLVGLRLYLFLKSWKGDTVESDQRLWVITAAAVGAAIGSKVLNWFTDPAKLLHDWNNPVFLMQGKTIVGGLIGGLIAVEGIKRIKGITRRTGDLFAIPLAVGIAIGRIGCFLTGLEDDTYGKATSLSWGVDFGDGIKRHPTQIYEIIFLAALSLWLYWAWKRPHREGDVFKTFMADYFGFRLLVDFLKPGVFVFGLTFIQWACAAMIVFYAADAPYVFGFRKAAA